MNYENRYITFFDILGFSNLIYSNKEKMPDNLFKIIEDLRSAFLKDGSSLRELGYKLLWKQDEIPEITQISDSLIISYPEKFETGALEICYDCLVAFSLLLENDFIGKCFIDFGKLIHTDKYLFGPTYIDAYHQEENEPMPMLKLSKSVYEKLLLIREYKMDDAIYHMLDCIHKTDDNSETYYIDYFNFYFDKELGLHDNDYFEILRNTITSNLENKNIDKVQAKYLWMKDNFNNCLYVKAGLIEKIEIN